MFALLAELPGVVVLHDFFLSGIIAHMDVTGAHPGLWVKELRQSHGYHAVQRRFKEKDSADVVWAFPCNRSVLQNARGVIVHSEVSLRMATEWYGPETGERWSVVPLLRAPSSTLDRESARRETKLPRDAFVICSFGMISPTKLNHRLLSSWLASDLSKDKRCILVFVGELPDSAYGRKITSVAIGSGLGDRVRVSGWSSPEVFQQYLAAADVAVQLRTMSRGETSAAVLDCMNSGLATIVNANGSMADLPDGTVLRIDDEFSDGDLTRALEALWRNEPQRKSLSEAAKSLVRSRHGPRDCAEQYARSIEDSYLCASTDSISVVRAINSLTATTVTSSEVATFAAQVASNVPLRPRPRQLLVDVSELVQRDSRSGIQRVVKSVLSLWLKNPPAGFHVEPVYAEPGREGFRYASRFTLAFLECPAVDSLDDDPIEICAGDVFVGLDLNPHIVARHREYFARLRSSGVSVRFVLYDLLCQTLPTAFSPGAADDLQRWLEVVAESDGVMCISRSVADEYHDWLQVHGVARHRPFEIGWFHLGSEVSESTPSLGLPQDSHTVLEALTARTSFIMVGTIEPRKGHAQTLAAFELLWSKGSAAQLVIVGKQGWMVEDLVARLRGHPEQHRRLFWLEGASDEYLEQIYAACACLVAASEGEGFGLPLVEAARHGIPILARDIPVFREVAGDHAFYFCAAKPETLAGSIQDWLTLNDLGKAPSSVAIRQFTWRESAANLLELALGRSIYRSWLADDVLRYWAGDDRFKSAVGVKQGRRIASDGRPGQLLCGPHAPLVAGRYSLRIRGEISPNGSGGARVEASSTQGSKRLASANLNASDNEGIIAEMGFEITEPITDFEVQIWVGIASQVSVHLVEVLPTVPMH
jgi:glycosyltransferase involved in cell wall biosynthesis